MLACDPKARPACSMGSRQTPGPRLRALHKARPPAGRRGDRVNFHPFLHIGIFMRNWVLEALPPEPEETAPGAFFLLPTATFPVPGSAEASFLSPRGPRPGRLPHSGLRRPEPGSEESPLLCVSSPHTPTTSGRGLDPKERVGTQSAAGAAVWG